MFLKWNPEIAKRTYVVIIRFATFNVILLVLAMMPGWITAPKIENEIKSYVSFVFNSLEKFCSSVDDLRAVIMSFNKVKFIETTKFSNKTTFIHLAKNELIDTTPNQVKITFSNEQLINKINVSRATSFNPDTNIIFSTEPQEILKTILPAYINLLYFFKITKTANPFLMVIPNLFLISFSFILSILLMSLWSTIKAFLFHRKKFQIKDQEFKIMNTMKTAQLHFLNTNLEHVYDDLHSVFHDANVENKHSQALWENQMSKISQSLGRIITFGTLKRDHGKISLIKDINIATDCFLEQILNKKLLILRKNFYNTVYVKQTELKNLLILCSIMHFFIINLPPNSQLSINIVHENEHTLKLIFHDNMPLPWRVFTDEEAELNNINILFLTFDKLIYACADEEIKVEHGSNASGNFFTLEYTLNRGQNNLNVIKGNFR